jgi:outer membrane receptor protein involved in Fe transport
VGLFVNEEISPAWWLRIDVGGRADLLSFTVDDLLAPGNPPAPGAGGGAGATHQLSPKTSVIVTPIDAERIHLEVYGNYGHGFHSNDVRGAFSVPAVTPLTRAIGEEIGARARLWRRWDVAAALWWLDLDSETVWSGDEGTTAVSGATNRRGIEIEGRYEFADWLAADVALTFTRSRFSRDRENGGGLALAPKQTWSGGLSTRHSIGPGALRGGLRFFGIADRPATDDGALVAPGFTQVDVHLGYRHQRFDVALDVENLLNRSFRSAQFSTTGRLQDEPAIGSPVPAGFGCGANARLAGSPDGTPAAGRFFGCEDVHFTPAAPLTIRLLATLYVD